MSFYIIRFHLGPAFFTFSHFGHLVSLSYFVIKRSSDSVKGPNVHNRDNPDLVITKAHSVLESLLQIVSDQDILQSRSIPFNDSCFK